MADGGASPPNPLARRCAVSFFSAKKTHSAHVLDVAISDNAGNHQIISDNFRCFQKIIKIFSDNFICFQMFSESAGNHRIISDNFIKRRGKIGFCVATNLDVFALLCSIPWLWSCGDVTIIETRHGNFTKSHQKHNICFVQKMYHLTEWSLSEV